MGNCKRRQGSVYFRTKNEQSVVATCIKCLRESIQFSILRLGRKRHASIRTCLDLFRRVINARVALSDLPLFRSIPNFENGISGTLNIF